MLHLEDMSLITAFQFLQLQIHHTSPNIIVHVCKHLLTNSASLDAWTIWGLSGVQGGNYLYVSFFIVPKACTPIPNIDKKKYTVNYQITLVLSIFDWFVLYLWGKHVSCIQLYIYIYNTCCVNDLCCGIIITSRKIHN